MSRRKVKLLVEKFRSSGSTLPRNFWDAARLRKAAVLNIWSVDVNAMFLQDSSLDTAHILEDDTPKWSS